MDQINEYPVEAFAIDPGAFFDIDQLIAPATWESQKVSGATMNSLFGGNLGNSDLQSTDPVRDFLIFGPDPDNHFFNIKDSTDTTDYLRVAAGGVITFDEEYAFPLVDGSANQVLQTDGFGQLSFGTAANVNIGNSDLIITDLGQRELRMAGPAASDISALRNNTDTFNLVEHKGNGAHRWWRTSNFIAFDLSSAGNASIGGTAGANYGLAITKTGTQANLFTTVVGTGGALGVQHASRTGAGGGVVSYSLNTMTSGFKSAVSAKVTGLGTRNTAIILEASDGTANIAADVMAGDFAFPVAGNGTMLGTATNNLIGKWGSAPIVQPTTAHAAAVFVANTSGIVDDTATFDGYTIGQAIKALRDSGALA